MSESFLRVATPTSSQPFISVFKGPEKSAELRIPSEYHHSTGKHRVCLEICMDTSFAIVQCVNEQPNAEQKSFRIITQPSSFPFERLPAEIRNMIYALVVRHKEKRSLQMNAAVHSDRISLCKSDYRSDPGLGAILLVNRRFNAEASPLLYAMNEFCFRNAKTCASWLRNIGPQNRYELRKIRVDSFSRTTNIAIRDMFTLLRDSENLTQLTFRGRDFQGVRRLLGTTGAHILPFMIDMLRKKDVESIKKGEKEFDNVEALLSILVLDWSFKDDQFEKDLRQKYRALMEQARRFTNTL